MISSQTHVFFYFLTAFVTRNFHANEFPDPLLATKWVREPFVHSQPITSNLICFSFLRYFPMLCALAACLSWNFKSDWNWNCVSIWTVRPQRTGAAHSFPRIIDSLICSHVLWLIRSNTTTTAAAPAPATHSKKVLLLFIPSSGFMIRVCYNVVHWCSGKQQQKQQHVNISRQFSAPSEQASERTTEPAGRPFNDRLMERQFCKIWIFPVIDSVAHAGGRRRGGGGIDEWTNASVMIRWGWKIDGHVGVID